MIEKGVQVFIRPLMAIEPEIGGALHRFGADIAIAGASVVDTDGIAHAAAQQLMDRLAAGPPPQIPQRDIDGRTAAHFRAAAGEAQIADQMRLMGLDGQGITPQQIGRDGLMDMRLNGARAVKTLAEAGDPVIG